MHFQNESDTDFSCATSQAARYWYSYAVGPVWTHSFSTEHSYAPGSAQRAWIEADLAAAVAARAAGAISWIIVQMHYPSYCSHTYDGGGGCISVVAACTQRAQRRGGLVLQHLDDAVLVEHGDSVQAARADNAAVLALFKVVEEEARAQGRERHLLRRVRDEQRLGNGDRVAAARAVQDAV